MIQTKKVITTLSILLVSLFLAAYASGATMKRSNFTVGNLSCSSCLANIEAELRGMKGALGMAADLRRGRVIVDHIDTLSHEQIAAAITGLGYPAAMEWTATLPEQYTNRFAGQNRYGSGCSSGGCTTSGGNGTGTASWKTPAAGSTVSRTTLKVGNLSCTSCLANIATELGKLSNTYGMNGYLSRGIVIVDHANDLESRRIAAIISGLGYPAKAVATNYIPAQKAFGPDPDRNNSRVPGVKQGSGCNSSSPCNATAASWQKLYNRYFTKTDTQ
jgi:copper chaperone CopZ